MIVKYLQPLIMVGDTKAFIFLLPTNKYSTMLFDYASFAAGRITSTSPCGRGITCTESNSPTR